MTYRGKTHWRAYALLGNWIATRLFLAAWRRQTRKEKEPPIPEFDYNSWGYDYPEAHEDYLHEFDNLQTFDS